MENIYKEYVISHYNRTLQLFGDRPDAVGWSSEGQLARFGDLIKTGHDIRGKKVLDYGCGKGDFYRFLKSRDIAVSYTGFDINEKLINLAKSKYPECRFEVFDIEEDTLTEDFDFIFLCGVFNLRMAGLDETVRGVLKKLFKHCRLTLCFNGLSAHTPRKAFDLHYIYPEDMVEFARQDLSPHVALGQGSIPHDIILFIHKNI
ncbi:MAG: class I SAM-dependent methyltransferase [Nitrospiraceae bacterium]|nr:MAG: class I SAM-dependent methyltransferase [Nitrospiraceae bacterium]